MHVYIFGVFPVAGNNVKKKFYEKKNEKKWCRLGCTIILQMYCKPRHCIATLVRLGKCIARGVWWLTDCIAI